MTLRALPALLALSACGQNQLPTSPTSGDAGAPRSHRATAVACPPRDGTVPCGSDADCHQFAALALCDHGSCNLDACTSDAQCGSLSVCACRGEVTTPDPSSGYRTCLKGNCRVDADCGPGGYCSPSVSPGCGPAYGLYGYFCHGPLDECLDDRGCVMGAGASATQGYCAYHPDLGRFACGYLFCH